MNIESMEFADGKYTLIFDGEELTALRYGEPWRDLTGDNLVYWMFVEALRLQEELTKAHALANVQ